MNSQFQPYSERDRVIEGLKLIPNHWVFTPTNLSKTPYRQGWQKEQLTKEEIIKLLLNGESHVSAKGKEYKMYPAGFAVRLGDVSDGLLALDFDGADSQKILDAIAAGQSLPDTVAWTSGRAGRYQQLFQVPLEYREKMKRITKIAIAEYNGIISEDALEIRYNNVTSTLPPSHHPKTGKYEWLLCPEEIEVAIAPSWLLEAILNYEKPVEIPIQSQATWTGFLASFEYRAFDSIPLIECLSKANRQFVSSGMSEGSRDDTAIAIALDAVGCEQWLMAVGQGFDGSAEEILRDYASRCDQSSHPLTDKDVQRWLKSARKSTNGSAIANKVGDEGMKALIAGYFWRREKPVNPPPSSTSSFQEKEVSKPTDKPKAKEEGFNFDSAKSTYQELRNAVESVLDNCDDSLERQFLFQQIAKSYRVRTDFLESIAIDIRHKKETQEFRWIEDELEEESEQRQWICPKHLARQSVQVWVAPGGSGKTLLANSLALAISKGEPFLESSCNHGKVLLCQSDTPRAEALQYFREAGFADAPERTIAVHYNWNFNQLNKLDQWLGQEKFDLCVIDSLAAANAGSGLDENSVLYAEGITRLNKLAEKHNTSFIVIHHANKAGDLRGSTAIRDNATELVHLKQQQDTLNRELYRSKSRTGYMEKLIISLDEETLTWEVTDCDAESNFLKADAQEKVIKHLELNAHREFTSTELVQDLKLTYEPKDIGKELRSLSRLGCCKSRNEWKEYKGERYKVIRFQGFVTENTRPPVTDPNIEELAF